ncbi:ABC transporter permease subunit [Collimonas sp. NPDC087041]|uniref:ABC transporter permease subunit n=1 Tax=Collimonas sp. NPDC087041 TaxID=3363960 RepID=UPI0038109407
MGFGEILSTLLHWSPFLARGFLWNILISSTAMAIGTLLGWGLATLRAAPPSWLSRGSIALTEFVRNVPTFVFQFYLVFMLPQEIALPGLNLLLPIPSWLKAALALAMAVTGFVSDNLLAAIRQWRQGNRGDALLFIPNWANYFVIIVMASSAASVIGVGELVSNCNTVVNAVGKTQMILWVYLYAMLWFFLFCYPLVQGMRLVRHWMERRATDR